MDENGFMLADTITPDGVYVNAKGEKTNYMPGGYRMTGDGNMSLKMAIMLLQPGSGGGWQLVLL